MIRRRGELIFAHLPSPPPFYERQRQELKNLINFVQMGTRKTGTVGYLWAMHEIAEGVTAHRFTRSQEPSIDHRPYWWPVGHRGGSDGAMSRIDRRRIFLVDQVT
jgi:hypothetical protein